jgi:hypothetical protein
VKLFSDVSDLDVIYYTAYTSEGIFFFFFFFCLCNEYCLFFEFVIFAVGICRLWLCNSHLCIPVLSVCIPLLTRLRKHALASFLCLCQALSISIVIKF